MHLLAVGITSAMLGLVLFLLIEVNQPFRGDIVLSPVHYEEALRSMTGPPQ